MAGIGDSWGTREELLHPRGPNGRWIHKAGVAKSIIGGLLDFLARFRPRTFQNQGQADQYLQNVVSRNPAKRMTHLEHARLRADLPHANADLQDGVIDDPSTKRFVSMMDRTAVELPDDTILTRVVGVEAFGFTPETANGTDADTDPGIRGLSGKLVADRGYGLHVIGEPTPGSTGPGKVRMIVAAPRGTKVIIPSGSASDPTIFTDRGQPLRVTKVVPDGQGGWNMYVAADHHAQSHEVPEPIGGPVGPGKPKDREAGVREITRVREQRTKTPNEAADQADEARRREAAKAVPPTAGQIEAEKRRRQEGPYSPEAQAESQRRQQELMQAGGPPPRTEQVVHPALGGERAPEPGAPQPQAPEAPVTPRRSVDLRRALRDAGVMSPGAGPKRKQFNDAYEGVISGKKDPIDAVRELGRDAADLDAQGDPDAEHFKGLARVIREQYGLEEPAAPKKQAPAKKAAGLTPAQEDAIVNRAKEWRGHERNDEERRIVRTADEILARRRGEAPTPTKAAKKAAPTKAAPGPQVVETPVGPVVTAPRGEVTPEDEVKGLFGGRRPTNAQLRQMGEENNLGFGPKEPRSEMIQAILGARPSRGRQRGELAPEEVRATEALRRPVKKVQAPEVQATKALRAPAKKAAPEAPGGDLDKMTKKELLEEAERRGVETPKSWTKDKIKQHLRDEEVHTPRKKTPEERKAQDKTDQALKQEIDRGVARQAASNPDEVRQKLVNMPHEDRAGYLDDLMQNLNLTESRRLAKGLSVRGQDRNDKQHIIQAIVRHFEGAEPELPAPVKKVAKKAAPEPFSAGRKAEEVSAAMTGAPGRERVDQGIKAMDGLNMTQLRQVARELGIAPPRKEQKESQSPEALREYIARNLDSFGSVGEGLHEAMARVPAKKVAKAAVPGAAPEAPVPGRIDRVFPRDIHVGDEILVEAGPHKGESRGRVARIERSGGKGNLNSYRFFNEDGEMFRDISPNGKANVRRGGAPESAAPGVDLEAAGRARQAEIDRAKVFGNLGTEIEELIGNDASPDALRSRIRGRAQREGIPDAAIQELLDAADNPAQLRDLARGLMARNGVTPIHAPGDVVPLDRKSHRGISGDIPDGTMVHVVRPGYEMKVGDENIRVKAVVEEATPTEVEAADLLRRGERVVPEGSVKGDRPQVPIDNAPRKRNFSEAWAEAGLDNATEGAGQRALSEVRARIEEGDLSPEEGIRRLEGEISFNQEDLHEVDANLRQPDLTPEDRDRLQSEAAKLQNAIEAQEKGAKFLRLYFADEKPTVEEIKINLDAEGYRALQDATPDDLREAARMQGLDPPKGDTKDEILKDMVRQVAEKEARRRGLLPKKAPAKKVAKAAKKAAPSIPADREKLDVRTIGAGIDFDENDKWTRDVLDDVQRALDGEDFRGLGKNLTPAAIGRNLEDHVTTSRMTTAVYEHGQWHDAGRFNPNVDPEDAARRNAEHKAEYDRVEAEVKKMRELAARLKGTRRRPVKKAASPEVKAAEDRADSVEARLINDRLEQIPKARSREAALSHLDGLTLPELRRIGDQMGIKGRSKDGLRQSIVDRLRPEGTPDRLTRQQILDQLSGDFENPMSREDAAALLAPLDKRELQEMAGGLSIPGAGRLSKEELRRQIVEATVGRRLDSIAIRGFRGTRPDQPGGQVSLSRRASDAGIQAPDEYFSDVQSAVARADKRLKAGDSPTEVARELRERAASVAKADLVEEGRRFKVEHDRSSLVALRKANAEYLRRVATHVQQEGKGPRPPTPPAKKAAPTREERIAQHPIKRGGLTLIRGEGQVTPSRIANPMGEGPRRLKAVPSAPAAPVKKATKKAAPEAPAKKAPLAKKAVPEAPKMSEKPLLENHWGTPGGEVNFHRDGIIGQGIRDMGIDARATDENGEPLGDTLGKLATRAQRGQISQEQLIQELKRLGAKLPAGSNARARVERMAQDLDAPKRAPLDLPDGTPKPITDLMRELSEIPLARGGGRRIGRGNFNEMDTLQGLVKQVNERYPEGEGAPELRQMRIMRWLRDQLREKIHNHRHESEEGKAQIDRAVLGAMKELERLVEEMRKART